MQLVVVEPYKGEMGIADRLLQARRDAGFRSILEFQQALPSEVRGTSYSSVRSYERGEATPPMEFVQAAARLLGVTESWLRTGKGPQTVGEAEVEGHRERQAKQAVSDSLWQLTIEVLDAYTQAPGPAVRLMQDLIFDLYYRRGPEAFGVTHEGEWRGWESAAMAGPELLIESSDVHRYLEENLGMVLFNPPVASYGEHVAQWLSVLSILYLKEFGSSI